MSAITASERCALTILNDGIFTTDEETHPLIVMFEEELNCGTSVAFELKVKLRSGLNACTGQWCNGITPTSLGQGTYMMMFPRNAIPVDKLNMLSLCYNYTTSGGTAQSDCYAIEIFLEQTLAVDFSNQCGLIKASNGFTTQLTSTKQNWALEEWVL